MGFNPFHTKVIVKPKENPKFIISKLPSKALVFTSTSTRAGTLTPHQNLRYYLFQFILLIKHNNLQLIDKTDFLLK